MRARIVVTEFMDDAAVAQLAAAHELLYDPKLVDDAPRLLREAASADALVVRNRTQVRGELLAALARCRVVGRLGVGLDNIDVAGCEAAGLAVVPATGANALSVAEYVIAAAMAPVAVHPDWQRKGIGSALIQRGLSICIDKNVPAVIVLGDPLFYPRFGFSAELGSFLKHPFPQGPHFMALELTPGVLASVPGARVRYPRAFRISG